MLEKKIRIAGIVSESVVDGPGIRFCVFVQGCPHNCFGCHNPHTHDFNGGEEVLISEIVEQIKKKDFIHGVTISGGEPFCQSSACYELGLQIKKLNKNLLIYSGYYLKELLDMSKKNKYVKKLLKITDILIDGPFILEKKDLSLAYRGSTNQNVINLKNFKI